MTPAKELAAQELAWEAAKARLDARLRQILGAEMFAIAMYHRKYDAVNLLNPKAELAFPVSVRRKLRTLGLKRIWVYDHTSRRDIEIPL